MHLASPLTVAALGLVTTLLASIVPLVVQRKTHESDLLREDRLRRYDELLQVTTTCGLFMSKVLISVFEITQFDDHGKHLGGEDGLRPIHEFDHLSEMRHQSSLLVLHDAPEAIRRSYGDFANTFGELSGAFDRLRSDDPNAQKILTDVRTRLASDVRDFYETSGKEMRAERDTTRAYLGWRRR